MDEPESPVLPITPYPTGRRVTGRNRPEQRKVIYTAAPPPQMVQVWPVSSGAGPAYGAGGVLGFGGDDLEAGDSVAWGSCFQAGYGPLESSMATGLMTDSFQPTQPTSYVTR